MKNSQNGKYKVLHIINALGTGGAEIMLLKLLSQTDRSVFDPTVISLTDIGSIGKEIEKLGVPVHSAGLKIGRPGPFPIFRLISLVRKLQPNLIQGWMYHSNLAAQLVNAFLSKPVPVLWNVRHSLHDLAYEKKMTAWIIRLCAKISGKPMRILYNSRTCAAQHEALGYSSEKRTVISNGFDTDAFAPSEEARNQIRQELRLPASSLLIGIVGRYHPMKDHANFLNAAAHLLKSHPETQFVMAGLNVAPDNRELVGLIQRLNLTQNVHLLGLRKDVNRLMASLDIASSSSAFGEGFPNVLGEAMACGVPCVATDVADNAWILGNAGRVVPIKDSEALANAWKELLEMAPNDRRELGIRARNRIKGEFSLDQIVSQYESLYHNVLEQFYSDASLKLQAKRA